MPRDRFDRGAAQVRDVIGVVSGQAVGLLHDAHSLGKWVAGPGRHGWSVLFASHPGDPRVRDLAGQCRQRDHVGGRRAAVADDQRVATGEVFSRRGRHVRQSKFEMRSRCQLADGRQASGAEPVGVVSTCRWHRSRRRLSQSAGGRGRRRACSPGAGESRGRAALRRPLVRRATDPRVRRPRPGSARAGCRPTGRSGPAAGSSARPARDR